MYDTRSDWLSLLLQFVFRRRMLDTISESINAAPLIFSGLQIHLAQDAVLEEPGRCKTAALLYHVGCTGAR